MEFKETLALAKKHYLQQGNQDLLEVYDAGNI